MEGTYFHQGTVLATVDKFVKDSVVLSQMRRSGGEWQQTFSNDRQALLQVLEVLEVQCLIQKEASHVGASVVRHSENDPSFEAGNGTSLGQHESETHP